MAVVAKGRELGFDLVGVAPAHPSQWRGYWTKWLGEGKAGDMHYLANRLEERLAPEVYLPGARSAVCVGVNYYTRLEPHVRKDGEVLGRVARYALGEDYHGWIKDRLYDLADWIREQVPGSKTRCGVDTAPIPERELSARAGVGWVGKNTCVINERMGSWLFLGTVLTTVELSYGTPAVDRCGTCRRCLEACPTGALRVDAPYELDASRCISYLTIESRAEEHPEELVKGMGNWIYGCDICQDVCPWNRRAPETTEPRLKPRIPTGYVDAAEVVGWGEERWYEFSRKTAIRRVGLPLFQRNARVVIRNDGGGGREGEERREE